MLIVFIYWYKAKDLWENYIYIYIYIYIFMMKLCRLMYLSNDAEHPPLILVCSIGDMVCN